MLRALKWILLIPVILLLGYICTERADVHNLAMRLTGVNAAAVGATCSPDWETINPFGNRFRFTLSPEAFHVMQRHQLTKENAWIDVSNDEELSYPVLESLANEDSFIYINQDLPTRTRWVVYTPSQQLLHLGYFPN